MGQKNDYKDIKVNFDNILELFDGDTETIKEFCEAGILSFNDFKDDYAKHLLGRNLKEFRKAGHRIKPVAKMLSVEAVNDEYQRAKQLLATNKDTTKLKESIQRMHKMSDIVIVKFEKKIEAL